MFKSVTTLILLSLNVSNIQLEQEVSFPHQLFAKYESVIHSFYDEYCHTVDYIKTDSHHIYLTNDDSCDGGNVYGLVLNKDYTLNGYVIDQEYYNKNEI